MWLLSTETHELMEFIGDDLPPYAILSHVWGQDEVKFQEMKMPTKVVQSTAGYKKVKAFCDLVYQKDELKYGWVDTACINKESSAELSENINSMFKYYCDAAICVVYLSDVLEDKDSTAFKDSEWFKRGWTLQELIASKKRAFFTKSWSEITTSSLGADIISLCSQKTGIHVKVLKDKTLAQTCSVAERLSWAANRTTTRPEDRAYSLIGLFDLGLSILYGEGLERAFTRLQLEIMKTSFDQSLFAWRAPKLEESGLLAKSPDYFDRSPEFGLWHPGRMFAPFAQTNIGVAFRPQVYSEGWVDFIFGTAKEVQAALQLDVRAADGWMLPTIRLRRVPDMYCFANGKQQTVWRRIKCGNFGLLKGRQLIVSKFEDVIIMDTRNNSLLNIAIDGHEDRQAESKWGTDTSAELPAAWTWH